MVEVLHFALSIAGLRIPLGYTKISIIYIEEFLENIYSVVAEIRIAHQKCLIVKLTPEMQFGYII